MDPALFTSKTCARALYEYKARRDDELTFPAGALISNVSPVISSKPEGKLDLIYFSLQEPTTSWTRRWSCWRAAWAASD